MNLLPRWMTSRAALALLIIGALMVAMALWAYGSKIVGAICLDGWESESTGRGRCSSHGGVDEDKVVDTLIGQQPVGWIGWTRWPALAFGAVGALTGLVGLIGLAGLGTKHPKHARAAKPTQLAATDTALTDRADGPAGPSVLAGEHLEFTVEIARRPKGYSVEVTTPTGQSRRTLQNQALPHDRGIAQLDALVASAARRRFGSRQAKAVVAFGTELFDAIFDGAIRQAFRDSINFALDHNATLRIVLQVDDAYADIPWEYLYDPDRGAFLARSHDTSLVRLLPISGSTRPQSEISCLRILSMAASPRHSAPLDIAAEQRHIGDALASSIEAGDVELAFVDGGSLAALNQTLADFQPHVFHFAGHGDWDGDKDDGVILFEDAAGFAQPVTGLDLGVVLNRPELRLAIFNSCHGATPSKHDRFAGITSSLVAQGVPAAVGMQFNFDDKAAVAFGTTLLRELGAGLALDDAVTRARMAVFSLPNPVEWGTPVLTTRVRVDQVIRRSYVTATHAR